MPDWSYNTIFKPLLFQLPAPQARDLTMKALYAVARMPLGRQLFLYMTNEAPEPSLALHLGNLKIPSPVSCGIGFELSGRMLDVFDTLGFGMIELGPITTSSSDSPANLFRQPDSLSITEDAAPGDVKKLVESLPKAPPSVPVFVRVAPTQSDTINQIALVVEALPSRVSGMTLDLRWTQSLTSEALAFLQQVKEICAAKNLKCILCIAPDREITDAQALARQAIEAGFDAISITGGVVNEGIRTYGAVTMQQSTEMLKNIRSVAPDIFIIASGGIIEPAHALEYLKTGANMVQLYSGLVYSGPGLPKRINELYAHSVDINPDSFVVVKSLPPAPPKSYSSPFTFTAISKAGGWLGFAVLGAGVLISCSSAITVGLTSVILPYDEKFLGISRDTMMHFNNNLLPFMSHDRVTYAGASISCGLLFIALSFFGARLGQRWAYNACLYASSFSMLSFLLFLGFHYLDPLHMLVTSLLLPFWLWGIFAKPQFVAPRAANAYNTKAWHQALYGQLLFVGIGIGLLLAGCTICYVGTHSVFVNEDLMFMHTTAQELLCHNARLLPAIAHDRAGFGATLVTAGIAVLGTALHGFRQGEGWVWWMLLISGLPGFVSTLAIHVCIGYMSFAHLLPAYIASIMFVAGLALSYKYLCVEPAT